MELTGMIKSISKDWQTDKWNITFEVESLPGAEVDDLLHRVLSITAKVFRKRRSLDANAYFHLLVDKLAKAMGISAIECKNLMLGRYGQIDEIDGEPLTFITSAPPEYMLKYEELHTRLYESGVMNTYLIIRGSHTYDSSEMAKLIDGVVSECEEQGIETMTPDEIERLKSLWQSR